MRISIVTATYNSEQTLERSICSVINQTYKNIEYIIIDGDSVDKTQDIINKYEKRISYWISEPDDGIYDAFNKGIKKSTGDYIYFLGSDDALINANTIEEVVCRLNRTKPDALSCPVMILDNEKGLEILSQYGRDNEYYFSGGMLPHQGFFVNSKIAKELLFSMKYDIVSDYDFIIRFLKKGCKIEYADTVVAYYSHGGMSSTLYNEKKKYNEIITVLESYGYETRNTRNRFIKVYTINRFKFIIKRVLSKLGMLEYFLIRNGWKEHKQKS